MAKCSARVIQPICLPSRDESGRPDDAPNLHSLSISMDTCQTGTNHVEWEWLQHLRRNTKRSDMTKSSFTNSDTLNLLTGGKRRTGSRSQVLQEFNWQVQGYNGLNAAQPDQPWGSTLTFQRIAKRGAGAARVLSRGVTMHPRGRHLREGRVLRSHGKSPALAREQLPPQQPLLPTRQQELQEENEAETRGIFIEAECRAVSPHQLEKTWDKYYLEHVAEKWTSNKGVWLVTTSRVKQIEKNTIELQLYIPYLQQGRNNGKIFVKRRPLYRWTSPQLSFPCETSVRGAPLRRGLQTGADHICSTKVD